VEGACHLPDQRRNVLQHVATYQYPMHIGDLFFSPLESLLHRAYRMLTIITTSRSPAIQLCHLRQRHHRSIP